MPDISIKDLNAQQQALTARVNMLEKQVSAQSLAQQALTAFAASIPKAPGLGGVLTLMSGLPGNLASLIAFPGVPNFQAMGLSLAMGMIGTVESSIIAAATAQLGGVLSAAQGALTTAQGTLTTLQAAVPPNPAAILSATSAVTAAQGVVSQATSAISNVGGFTSAITNSAGGLIKSAIKAR